MKNVIDTLDSVQLKKLQLIELDTLKEIDRICRKYDINYSLTGGTLLGAIRHKGFIPWDDDVDIALKRKDFIRLQRVCQKELKSEFFFQCHDSDKGWYRLYSKIRVNGTQFKELAHCQHDIHHGVYIDIFALDNVPNNKILRHLQYIYFQFFNIGLSVKYINSSYRKRNKRIIAILLKVLYFPFSLDFLYKTADRISKRYNNCSCIFLTNFNGAYGKKEVFPQKYFLETIDMPFEDTYLKCSKYFDDILSQLYGDYMQLPSPDKRVSLHKIIEMDLDY